MQTSTRLLFHIVRTDGAKSCACGHTNPKALVRAEWADRLGDLVCRACSGMVRVEARTRQSDWDRSAPAIALSVDRVSTPTTPIQSPPYAVRYELSPSQ